MAKTHDSLGRKLRDKPQKERSARVSLTERDLLWFAFLERHGGMLPTSYLHDSTKHLYKALQSSQERLTKLARAGYLDRPFQQFETKDPEYNELVHRLTDKAIDTLKAHGLFTGSELHGGNLFKHQLATACISASIELQAREYGIPYKPQHEVAPRIAVDLDRGVLIPDAICHLTPARPILVFLEMDRGTEKVEDSDHRRSYRGIVRQYRELIGRKKYQAHYGTDGGALMIFVTISETKRQRFLEEVAKEFPSAEYPKGCQYILTAVMPEFGRLFRPPRRIPFLDFSFIRLGYPAFLFQKVVVA